MVYAADTMRHDGDKTRHDGDTTDSHRVPVIEAAELLGITPDAVRARLRRGTLPKEEGPDGETLVVLDADTMPQGTDTTTDTMRQVADTTALVESLREQVSYLKETVAKRDEEIRRRDHLLAAALERIPAIEAPPDTPSDIRESPVSASDEAGDAGVPSEPERPVSWWRRLFGT